MFLTLNHICPNTWTFKRAHVNDFFESGDVGLWVDHDWPEWASKVGITQVALTRFMLEHNMDLSFDDDQHLMVNKEEEGDDKMISC